MNTRSNPAPPPSTREGKKSKKAPAKSKQTIKGRKRSLTVTVAPGRDIDHGKKRQRQTSLTVSASVAPDNSKSPGPIGAAANRAGPASNTGGQSVHSSMADTSSTYLDTEAIRIEEQRKPPSYNLTLNRSMTMPASANIVSVGIRRGPPSSIGSSSIRPSSSISQRAMTPNLNAYNPTPSQFMGSSPLRFEAPLSPIADEPSPNAIPFKITDEPRTPADVKSRYSSRSILGPGDLKVTAVLETTCRMMEKYLLSKNPFPTDPELLAVTVYIYPQALCATGLMILE